MSEPINSIKDIALAKAESLKEAAAKEAERVKVIAEAKATRLKEEKDTKDKLEAEKLKEQAVAVAAILKDSAEIDAENLMKIAESVAKKQLQLLLENAMFKAIFDTINDGAIVTDTTGKILFYNKAAVMILGINLLDDHDPSTFAKYFNFYKPDQVTP